MDVIRKYIMQEMIRAKERKSRRGEEINNGGRGSYLEEEHSRWRKRAV